MIAGERARESECNHSYTLGWNFNLYVNTRFVGTDPMRFPMQHGRVMQRLYLPVTRISNRAHFQPFAFRIRMASIDSGKARFNGVSRVLRWTSTRSLTISCFGYA